jgi:hypothetical protein
LEPASAWIDSGAVVDMTIVNCAKWFARPAGHFLGLMSYHFWCSDMGRSQTGRPSENARYPLPHFGDRGGWPPCGVHQRRLHEGIEVHEEFNVVGVQWFWDFLKE